MSSDDLTPQFIARMAGILARLSIGHSALENRFLGAGAPGPAPGGSMLDKATEWLQRMSADETVDSLQVVGKMIEPVMERERPPEAYEQIGRALAEQNLTYAGEGRILGGTLSAPSRSLAELIQARDRPAINEEFDRAPA